MSKAREEIARLLVAAHRGADEAGLLRRLEKIEGEARKHGLEEAEIEDQLRSWSVQFPRRRHDWISADAAMADLRGLFGDPQTRGARTWRRLRDVASWFFDHYVAVASLVTLVAGAFYGLAYALFYDALDITPEQAGLGPAEILTRSVLGGVFLVLLLSLGVISLYISIIAVRDDPSAREENGSWAAWLFNAFLTFVGAAILFGLSRAAGMPPPAAVLVAAIPVCFLLLASFRINKRRRLGLRPLRFSIDRYLTVYVALAVPIALFFTAVGTLSLASFYGLKASEGVAVRDPKILGLPFLGVRAEPALIFWKDKGDPGAGFPHCASYLGGNGDTVFYDHRSGSTFHVPSGDVTVELRADQSSCDDPMNARVPSIRLLAGGVLSCDPGEWYSQIDPDLSYRWVSEGVPIENEDEPAWLFEPREPWVWMGRLLNCRVSASTALGNDTAISKAFRITPAVHLPPSVEDAREVG